MSHSFGWPAGGCLLPGKLSLHSDKLISFTNKQSSSGEAGKCPKSAGEAMLKRDFPGEAMLKRDFPANPGDLATMGSTVLPIRPYLIDFMFRGSGGSDFCSLQKKKKKKSGRAPAHAYEHQIASS